MTRKMHLTLFYGTGGWAALIAIIYLYAAASGWGPGDLVSWLGVAAIGGGPLLAYLGVRAWADWSPD
jgi:hypothetical protein